MLRLRGLIHNEHLEPVLHIGVAGVRIQVQGQDLHAGTLLEPLGDAPAAHVVGQAPKGLEDDEGPDPLVGVVGDLARHQPALAAGEGLGMKCSTSLYRS